MDQSNDPQIVSARRPSAAYRRSGALVISLDFELHWGVRDRRSTTGPYAANLLGARAAIPRLLELFGRFDIAATWATVGFLFAKNRDELLAHAPALRPGYVDRRLDAYAEAIGVDEERDPLHFAPSLIERIASTPRQEIASHTFSHYYCLERGQTGNEFAADLGAAKSIARARGIDLRSLVLPRNQLNRAYAPALRELGFVAYRSNQSHWAFEERSGEDTDVRQRIVRWVDSYMPITGHHAHAWDRLSVDQGVVEVPASLFLRPSPKGLGALCVHRVVRAMERAARTGAICHLWWHPHNFGAHTSRKLAELESILRAYRRLRDEYGMASYTMSGVADVVLAG